MTKLKQLAFVTAVISACALFPTEASPQYVVENLGRGVIAIRASESTVYVGWRLLGTDPSDVAFNVYRASGSGAPVKLNEAPLVATTNLVDTSADLTQATTYTVRPVLQGTELAASTPFVLPAGAPIRQYLTVPLDRPAGGNVEVPAGSPTSAFTYSPNDASAGDLDGDGEYEIILKWDPSNSRDNASAGLSGRQLTRCLQDRRHAALADRSGPQHQGRRALHAVHGLRPRRRRPRRNGVQDGRRHGRWRRHGHWRRDQGLPLADRADRRHSSTGDQRRTLRQGPRRTRILHHLRRRDRRRAGDNGVPARSRSAGRVGRNRRQRQQRQQRQPRRSHARRRRLPGRPPAKRDHGPRLLRPHRSWRRGTGGTDS